MVRGEALQPIVNTIGIHDSKSDTTHPIEIESPLYFVGWTGDSRNIVTITHVAGGTLAGVIHFKDGHWIQRITGPAEGDASSVVRLVLRKATIELTYAVHVKPRSENADGKFFLSTYVFNPNTDNRTIEKTRDIDVDTFLRVRFETVTAWDRD